MATYELELFVDRRSAGSVAFEAASNPEAAVIGTAIFQSSTDVCDSFELRRETAWIAGMTKAGIRKALSAAELKSVTRKQIADLACTLLDSSTGISKSKALFASVARWRKAPTLHLWPVAE